jgi:hypothetical protein
MPDQPSPRRRFQFRLRTLRLLYADRPNQAFMRADFFLSRRVGVVLGAKDFGHLLDRSTLLALPCCLAAVLADGQNGDCETPTPDDEGHE